jgi:hypothetical protein
VCRSHGIPGEFHPSI